jgi:diguanylate cyclase (GGDEF)-like protein
MKFPQFTVTRKVAAGYLLIVFFSMVAIVYALGSLHAQTSRSERLISVDFRALGQVRNLRQNLLAQENLEKQFLILRDPAFLDLLKSRQDEEKTCWSSLSTLPLPSFLARAGPLAAGYRGKAAACLELLGSSSWGEAKACTDTLVQLRGSLIDSLDDFSADRQHALDRTLAEFNKGSARAYRITLLLVFIGIALSAPAAAAIVFSIHRAVGSLTRAAREIAAGSFDHPISIADRQDEFGLLAREFREMGHKLRELEQLRLDANPLTHLPGNLAIEREMEKRLRIGRPFAHLYLDLDHFKAYNDRYGYRSGSEVIARVASLTREAVRRCGTSEDLVGHIGGDDFVVLTALERGEALAQTVVEAFDRMIPDFYSEEDRRAGFFIAQDRFGEERRFPLLTISIAIVCSDHLETQSSQAISRECVQMKEHLKALPGSNYLIDRRKIS